MTKEWGPVFRAEDWVKYVAKREKVSEVSLGETLVVTPIGSINSSLVKFFNAKPWVNWIYKPDSLWGVKAADIFGHRVSFMTISPGAPQISIVEETIVAGVKRIIFIGLAGGLGVEVGDLVVPYGAICEDGFSQHYIPYGVPIEASRKLHEYILKACSELGCRVHSGRVWTTSAPYRELKWKAEEYYEKWECRAVEMEAGAVYALGTYYGVERVALLVISDLVYPVQEFGFHEERLKETVNKIPLILKRFFFYCFKEEMRQTESQS